MVQDLRFYVTFGLVVVLALLGSERRTATQSSTVSYGVSDLGTIGGNRTLARSISRNGFPRIVGTATTAAGDNHVFEGNAHTIRDIGTLGGRTSEGFANSDAGFVGRSQVATGAFHAFRDSFPGIIDLGTLGGSESRATAINDSGVIVGASQVSGDAATRAFLYENGTMSLLPATLGGADVVANDINNNRQVVGYAQRPGGQTHHAFLYADGLTIDLGSLGGTSEALAINDAGVIIGRSQLASGPIHAFRHENGVMQDLGTLGGADSEALNISRERVIVGWSDTSAGERHAFVWRDGVMTDLNTLIPPGTGWVLEAATGIGDERTGGPPRAGAIVGYGRLSGQVRSFILTPPLDLSVSLTLHANNVDTNIPNPHEAGKEILWGVSVSNSSGLTGTGLTITNMIGGPVEFLGAFVNGGAAFEGCDQTGQQIVCRIGKIDFDRSLFLRVRSTAAGQITHSATLTADQPDPSPGNNSRSESNTAVSLQSLTLDPTTIFGGQLSLGRTTLTSRTPLGGATIPLTSSRPDIAMVPSPFDVLPDANDGLYREFYVRTNAVTVPVTVDISASYGLVTQTVPLTLMPEGGQWPYADSARQIPGTIQAEDFDEGGEGAAYHDTGRDNDGGAYRPTDVDLEVTADAGGGYNVGWISGGEWLEYTTNVAATGTYTMEARVASPGAGGTFHVEVDGVNKTGTLSVPDTGGWQEWRTVSKTVTLDAGLHLVRVSFDTSGPTGAVGNLNYLRFVSTGGPVPTPFGGTPRAIPGTVQAEDFDDGGEGVAYHDDEAQNLGGAYNRPTGVDIEATSDPDGGYNVGWMTEGEWLNYTVSVPQSGTYALTTRVAASGAGGRFHLEFDGVDKTGPMTIPDTVGWQNWTTLTAQCHARGGDAVDALRRRSERANRHFWKSRLHRRGIRRRGPGRHRLVFDKSLHGRRLVPDRGRRCRRRRESAHARRRIAHSRGAGPRPGRLRGRDVRRAGEYPVPPLAAAPRHRRYEIQRIGMDPVFGCACERQCDLPDRIELRATGES